ncbi:MAG: LamG-like jellyroll fold domain-containing protein, partial [Bacteroidia bacterium]
MKKFVSSLMLVLALGMPWALAQPMPELIYYQFDSGASIINSASSPVGANPASITGSGLSVGNVGLSATALVGTGTSSTSDFVNTGWATNLSGSWTIGFWTKDILPSSTLWYIFGDNTANSLRCFTNGAAGANNWRLIGTGLPAVQATNAATTAPTYTHFVYDAIAGQVRSYVNGVLDQTVAVTAAPVFNGTQFKVGAYASNSNLNGLMDEFRIYNRALDVAEILATINGPIVSGPCTTAIAGVVSASPALSCPGEPISLSASGTTFGSGAFYQWQSSADGVVFADISGATQPAYQAFPFATTYYRLIVGCGGLLDTSNVAMVTVDGTPLPAGTYTAGSATADFPTLDSLTTKLNCGGIAGAVNILLTGTNGILNGQLRLGNVAGAGAASPLTIWGIGDTLVATGSNQAAILLDGSSYVNIRNLVIRGTGVKSGIMMQNVEHINIQENLIILDQTITTSTFGGIIATGNFANLTTGTSANFVNVDSNTIIGGYTGIRFNGLAGARNQFVNVRNNQLRDWYIHGIFMLQTEYANVSNNEVSRPTRTGITTFNGIYMSTGTHGALVNANRIHTSNAPGASLTAAANGIYFLGASASTAEPNIISNNLIYNLNSGSGTVYGIYNSGGSSNYFYHNTVVLNHAASTAGITYGVYILGTGTDNQVLNNIVYISRGGTGTKYCLYYLATNTPVSNYNVLNMLSTGGTANHIGFFGSAQSTMADWQVVNGGIFDLNSTTNDPDFASAAANDYAPTNFFVNNTGVNLLAFVGTDFFGTPRSVSPDPGAIEFNPAPVDAGLGNMFIVTGGIAVPLRDGCVPGLVNPFELEVYNSGADTIASMQVNYRLNSQAVVSETIPGPIVPGTLIQHRFAGMLSLQNGNDTIIAWVVVAGDGNSANDTVMRIVNNYQTTVYAVPFSENFNSGNLPANPCTELGSNAKVEVLGIAGGNNLAIEGSHSLVMSGLPAGTPWIEPTNANWIFTNPEFNSSLTYYIKADTLSRLAVSFKLRQLFRSTSNSSGFQLLVNDQPISPLGYASPILRPANAAASNDTLNLLYDLDAFVGDTVKITLFSNVRWDYTGSPIHGNIIDELNIFQPLSVAFDSVTVYENSCAAAPKPVAAMVTSAFPVTGMQINYSFANGPVQNVPMTFNAGAGSWNGTLPAANDGDTVMYWLSATNTNGNFGSDTLSFVEAYLHFDIGPNPTITAGDSITLFSGISGGSAVDSLFSGHANNGSGAVMFELMSNKGIKIEAFDVYYTGTNSISVYYKTGTFQGFESNASAWTLHGTISQTGNGTTVP